MLIQAYGLFWRDEEIDWNGRRGKTTEVPRFALLGRRGVKASNLQVADFMDQRGLYILYGNHGPHYVGVTVKRGLGVRLKEHRTDHLRNRWDRFSWYGFRKVSRKRSELGLSQLAALALATSVVHRSMILEMEALLINAMGLHNIRPGKFPVGLEWTQIRRDERELFLERLGK